MRTVAALLDAQPRNIGKPYEIIIFFTFFLSCRCDGLLLSPRTHSLDTGHLPVVRFTTMSGSHVSQQVQQVERIPVPLFLFPSICGEQYLAMSRLGCRSALPCANLVITCAAIHRAAICARSPEHGHGEHDWLYETRSDRAPFWRGCFRPVQDRFRLGAILSSCMGSG